MSLTLAGISSGGQPALFYIAGISAGPTPLRLILAGISAAAPPLRLTLSGLALASVSDPSIVTLNRTNTPVTSMRKGIGPVHVHRKGTPKPLGVSGSWSLILEDTFETLNPNTWTPLRGKIGSTYNTPYNQTLEDAAYAADHVTSNGASLILRADPSPTLGTNAVTYPYTSGVITSEGKFSYRYGYAESRIAVPTNTAWWPAWWMCAPDHWPPEIDIAEFFSTPLGTLGATTNTHWADDTGAHQQNSPHPYGAGLQDMAFHTYGLLWTPNYIQTFFDGQAGPIITDGVPQEAMFFIYNLGLWKGKNPGPAHMAIDYLRVWQN